MNTYDQKGFVLVFAILLLLIMTLIGISVMSGSQMQERMAGNARLQSLAFQATTAGVADAVPFVKWLAPSGLVCGESDYDEYAAVWLDGDGKPRTTKWYRHGGPDGFGSELPGDNMSVQSRLYCLYENPEDQARSELYVESQGFVTIDGRPVAQRSVEVRVVSGRDSTLGDPTCAVQALCVDDHNPVSAFNPPASNASFAGGDTGHAFCTCNNDMRDIIVDEIASNRVKNFTGVEGQGEDAIQNIQPSSPFDSVEDFEDFITQLETVGIHTDGGDHSGFEWHDEIRFIDGDLYAAGGSSGSGILVVTGNIELRGNFRYDGLIIGMGDILSLRGSGGKKHGVRGTVIAAPFDRAGSSVSDVNLSFHEPGGPGAGGGGVSYAFDCDALERAEGLLNETTAKGVWHANCDGGIQNIFDSGPAELQLVSWRENLGWREKVGFFSAEEVVVSLP